jgi:phosphoglycerol transferase MdoB-like AlkP superfamily enzyme
MEYHIIVASDHGMNANGTHGGNQESVRRLPLYIYSPYVKPTIGEQTVTQLVVAPLLCRMLGLRRSENMINLQESGVEILE